MVTSLGLLYTTLGQNGDSIMVPNNVVLTAAIVPLREPTAVDLRARLRPDVKPSVADEVLAAIGAVTRGDEDEDDEPGDGRRRFEPGSFDG